MTFRVLSIDEICKFGSRTKDIDGNSKSAMPDLKPVCPFRLTNGNLWIYSYY